MSAGVSVLMALVASAGGLLSVPGHAAQVRTRVFGLLVVPAVRRPEGRAPRPVVMVGALAALAAVTVAAGQWKAAAALIAFGGAGLVLLRRRGERATTVDPLAVAATFDMLAACLRAGLPVATACAAVADRAPASLSAPLRRASDLLALGADPTQAWAALESNTVTEPLARLARRSAGTGSALAEGVEDLATSARAQAQDDAVAAAERAAVAVSGPLGLCFLPAFLCLGIAPVVIGLAGRVLGGGVL